MPIHKSDGLDAVISPGISASVRANHAASLAAVSGRTARPWTACRPREPSLSCDTFRHIPTVLGPSPIHSNDRKSVKYWSAPWKFSLQVVPQIFGLLRRSPSPTGTYLRNSGAIRTSIECGDFLAYLSYNTVSQVFQVGVPQDVTCLMQGLNDGVLV